MNGIKNIFSKKYIKKYQEKISFLNREDRVDLNTFLLKRLFIEIIIAILCLLVPKYGILLAIAIVLLFHFIYTGIIIDSKIDKRINSLYEEAITFYNMILLSYKDNNDLKMSIDIVTNKLDNSLAIEFKNVLGNNKYNNDLREVFNEVIKTIPNHDVKNTLIDLKDAENIEKSLESIINLLQEKDIIITESKYQFKPIYLTFISICFLGLILFIIFNLVNIINYINNLLRL